MKFVGAVRLGKDNLYHGNSDNKTVAVYEKNGNNAANLVAIIEFIGIVGFPHKTVVSYGLNYEFRATLLVSKDKQPGVDLFYSRIAIKEDCASKSLSSTSLAKIDPRMNIAIFKNKWEVVYKSEGRYSLFTRHPKLCICLDEHCDRAEDYNHFVKTIAIEGPMLIAPIRAACTVGTRCIMEIDGYFKEAKNYFALSKDASLTNGHMSFTLPNVYEYNMSLSGFSAFKTVTLKIYWIPGLKYADVNPVIGEVEVMSFYVGTFPVAPFGAQSLVLDPTHFCSHKFYIYKRIKTETVMPNPELQAELWSLDRTVVLSNKMIGITGGFNAGDLYILKSIKGCEVSTGTGGDNASESNNFEKEVLVAHLVPTGVTKYKRYVCEFGMTCKIEFPTIGLTELISKGVQRGYNYQVLLAKRCGTGFDKTPFLTPNGLSSSEKISSDSSEFSWSGNAFPDLSFINTQLRACWCDKASVDAYTCQGDDYSIDIGTVLIVGETRKTYKCWLGAMCSITLRGHYDRGADEIIMSRACSNPGDVTSDQDDAFDYENLKSATGDEVTVITTEIDVVDEMVGVMRLCRRSKGSRLKFTDLGIEVEVTRMALEKKRYIVGMNGSALVKAKVPIEGEQYILVKQLQDEVGDAIAHRKLFTDHGMRVETRVRAGYSKISWCMTSQHMRCTRLEDFRLNLADLTTEGILNLKGPIKCINWEMCKLTFAFQSMFAMLTEAPHLADPGSVLVLRKKECSEGASMGDVHVFGGYHDKAVVHEQTNDLFVLRYLKDYSRKLYGLTPGQYFLCFQSKDKMVEMSKIDVVGMLNE
ncbi:hypothetical protein BEWA_029860 [Theileria equi strain WA]|uniref:Uncharacterized protein n=1 Tax=Theileria equi strain WA TaxID=1537102 RepID=L0AX47_THEEQ|nr:hypothetical protein BEWA_029860 [Theileria equi strain WA]AFZ80135.1 hypothetical protein BEWA_029860 [Theileria equi strain WA]|eukprot:XP_004829801.1 hypothetical protein BEWA_029860 [Theileria equi strain WA]